MRAYAFVCLAFVTAAVGGCKRGFAECDLPSGFDYANASLTILEGVPRKLEGVDSTQIIKRRERDFFRAMTTSTDVSADSDQGRAIAELRSLFVSRAVRFDPFRAKGCIFHPDYEIVWAHGRDVVEMHICYGCDELRAWSNDEYVGVCEINAMSMATLQRLLAPFGKHPHRE